MVLSSSDSRIATRIPRAASSASSARAIVDLPEPGRPVSHAANTSRLRVRVRALGLEALGVEDVLDEAEELPAHDLGELGVPDGARHDETAERDERRAHGEE